MEDATNPVNPRGFARGASSRTLWYMNQELLDSDDSEGDTVMEFYPADEDHANLVSSRLENGHHSPVLDVDFPARLEPSSTPGHFHLYLEGIEMSWPTYEALLVALGEAGVIGPGYLRHSIAREQTMVRRPHIKKPKE